MDWFVPAPPADGLKRNLAYIVVIIGFALADDKTGDLVLTTAGGSELRQVRPKVYQQVGDRRIEAAGGYELLDRGRAAFTLAAYDQRRPLVIDPTVPSPSF